MVEISKLPEPYARRWINFIVFWILTKKAALASIRQWPTGAEQGEQAEECNIFVHEGSHFSMLRQQTADNAESSLIVGGWGGGGKHFPKSV